MLEIYFLPGHLLRCCSARGCVTGFSWFSPATIEACVVYFDQLLGAVRTQKLVQLLTRHVCLKSVRECIPVHGFFPEFSNRKTPSIVDL